MEVRSDDELNPSTFQKVTKYALFFAIAAVRDPSVLDILVRVAKDPNM